MHPILVSLLIALAIYIPVVALTVFPWIDPLSRRLLIALTVVEAVMVGLNSQLSRMPAFWKWYLNTRMEFNLGATFSSVQAMTITLVLVVIALRSKARWQRGYWLLLAAIFVLVAGDEYFVLHERLPGEGTILYAAIGLMAVGITILVYWFGFRRQETRTILMILGGLGLAAFGGIVLDVAVISRDCFDLITFDLCEGGFGFIEEFFEMAGFTIILVSVLSYARRGEHTTVGRGGWGVVLAGSGLWLIALLVAFWVYPRLEAQWLATPVRAEYFDGDFGLIGYRLSDDVLAPGDSLSIDLYWQLNAVVPENYGLSMHLLSRPEANSVTQSDINIGNPQTRDWLPGLVGKRTVELTVPDDITVPGSYWLTVSLWDEQDFAMQTVGDTDRQLLTPDSLILAGIPIVAQTDPPPPPTTAAYRFEGGFTLIGYESPSSDLPNNILQLGFWWETQNEVSLDTDLTQFVHLIHRDSEEAFSFDRQPFDGRFLTSDWPENMAVVDSMSLTLPDDLPPGEYDLYTGLYDPLTLDRQSVAGADGQPVPDNTILLGTVRRGASS